MNKYSLLDKKYIEGNYVPQLCEYYDRSDMVNTTFQFNHAHTLAEIMYVRHGMISLKIGNDTIMLGRKQYVWIDAGVPHQNLYFETDKVSMINIEYNYTIDDSIPSLKNLYNQYEPISYLFDHPKPYKVFTDHDNSIYLLLKQMTQTGTLTEDTKKLNSILCSELLLLLGNYWRIEESRGENNNFLQSIHHYLQEHYAKKIEIKDIALHLGISSNYLQKKYKKLSNSTITEQLNNIRLEHAKSIKETENISITKIADRVGMTSSRQLQKLFLKKYQINIQDLPKMN